MTFTGLIVKSKFDEADIQAIKALEAIVNAADNIKVKFNWSMIHQRQPEAGSDFCYYIEGKLVGYMPLDGFGETYEITAAVLPEYRRLGIFKQLCEAAIRQARHLMAIRLLLVNYRESKSGIAAVQAMQIPYDFSEYNMPTEDPALPSLMRERLRLKAVEEKDLAKYAEMLTINFGKSDFNSQEKLRDSLARPEEPYFLALLDEYKEEDKQKEEEAGKEAKIIGHIGAVLEDKSVYIRSVGILPEWRQQGYGRELLAVTVRKLSAEGHKRFELDVATSNAGALTLYESCGFTIANVYDYHLVPMDKNVT